MTGWKIALYRFAVKRETRWREKASRCFFWGASMKRLRCVRALGERSLKWQGLIKSIFVGRNNTSVREEITEGASISSKNNYTSNTSSHSTPNHPLLPALKTPGGLSDSSAGASVPSVCHAGTSTGSRWRGTKPAFVAQCWHHLLQVSFSPTEFVNHLGRSSHFESILKRLPSWTQVKSWCTNTRIESKLNQRSATLLEEKVPNKTLKWNGSWDSLFLVTVSFDGPLLIDTLLTMSTNSH